MNGNNTQEGLVILGIMYITIYGIISAIAYTVALGEIEELTEERDVYQCYYEKAEELHENLDEEVEKAFVDDLNELAERIMKKEPIIELIPYYVMINESYIGLNEDQKEYVNFEIKDVRENLAKAKELKSFMDKVSTD